MWVTINVFFTQIILCPYSSHVVPPNLLISRRCLLLYITPILLLAAITTIILLLAVAVALLVVVIAPVLLLIVSFVVALSRQCLRPGVCDTSNCAWKHRFVLPHVQVAYCFLFFCHVAMS